MPHCGFKGSAMRTRHFSPVVRRPDETGFRWISLALHYSSAPARAFLTMSCLRPVRRALHRRREADALVAQPMVGPAQRPRETVWGGCEPRETKPSDLRAGSDAAAAPPCTGGGGGLCGGASSRGAQESRRSRRGSVLRLGRRPRSAPLRGWRSSLQSSRSRLQPATRRTRGARSGAMTDSGNTRL